MELNCKFEDDMWSNGSKYSALVTLASITKPGTVIKSVKSAESPKKEVKGLDLKSTIVHYFPCDVNKHFPNLTHLRIYDCGLKSLTRRDLQGLDQLEYLSLANNLLTSLPNDLFVGMKNLRRIFFNNNKIEIMSSKLLEPIKENDLEFIDFKENTKISDYYHKNVHNTLEALMESIDKKCTPPVEIEKICKSDDSHNTKFQDFYATGKFSDFTIKVREKEYKVHKNILAARSSVFEEMFSGDGDAGAKTLMNIKNFNEEAFDDFISFFYFGAVKSKTNVFGTFRACC